MRFTLVSLFSCQLISSLLLLFSVHDPLNEVEKDLNILSRDLYSNLDQIQQEQVRRLLKDVGVKSMTPSDLITNHIIPLFKEGHWQVSLVKEGWTNFIFVIQTTQQQLTILRLNNVGPK